MRLNTRSYIHFYHPLSRFSYKINLMEMSYKDMESELTFRCMDRHSNKFDKLKDNYFRGPKIYLNRRLNV